MRLRLPGGVRGRIRTVAWVAVVMAVVAAWPASSEGTKSARDEASRKERVDRTLGADSAVGSQAEESRGRRRSRITERWQQATPAERREMRENLRERWRDASPRQRRQLGRRMKVLERRLPDFSVIERLVLLRAAAALPEAERKVLRERIAGIDDLEPAERARLIADLEQMIEAYAREVDRLERNTGRWQDMSAAERAEVREQMQRLREMSIEERRALLEEMEREGSGARGER